VHLIDEGSAIDIMPKSRMNELEITIEELSKSRRVIQEFSLESQRAIGMIHLEITMEDLLTSSIFHVIDSKTSYKFLLGCQWLHEYGIMASTLHQCLKYYHGGDKKINGDVKPFTKAELHFATKFFEDGTVSKETTPSMIFSTSRGKPNVTNNFKVVLRQHSMKQQEYRKGNVKQEAITQLAKHVTKQVVVSINHMLSVLRYVPEARRKEKETPLLS